MNDRNLAFAEGTRLATEDLSRFIQAARNKYHVPAIAVTLMNSDKILVQQIQGTRIIDQDNPATLNDYFHIGSCAKSVLALIAEKFIEANKITWQTQFFNIYLELKHSSKPDYLHMTLEDLFMCEAGIRPYMSSAEAFPKIESSVSNCRLEFIKYLIQQPPASEQKNARFRHRYSNASYVMASAMLERVAGKDYENLVVQTLDSELGMSVRIGWPNRINLKQPWGHVITQNNVEAFSPENAYGIPDLLTPAGDLSLTPEDYAKYTQLHLKELRGENNYISSDGYRFIHFGHKGFSLGVVNGTLARKRFSAFDGSAGTFFCRSIIVPEADLAIAIMMNAGSGNGVMKAADWLTMRIIKKHFDWWWKLWI